VSVGSDGFSGTSFSITCPIGLGVLFYKKTNWGGGCCGGYTRNYLVGNETFKACP
jgi:hypothetical protein